MEPMWILCGRTEGILAIFLFLGWSKPPCQMTALSVSIWTQFYLDSILLKLTLAVLIQGITFFEEGLCNL